MINRKTPSQAPAGTGLRVRRTRHFRRWALAATAALILAVLMIWLVMTRLGLSPKALAQALSDRPAMELVRYAERRLEGHPRLEAVLHPVLAMVRARLEREPPATLQDLGKGQRPLGLTALQFDAAGQPLAAAALVAAIRPPVADRVMATTAEIASAMSEALPGQVLEIAPGAYTIKQALTTGKAGFPGRPITLRALRPGTVTLLVDTVQAMVVTQPYWVFENLDWRGVCRHDDDCEHAFHVVGRAVGTVVLNNHLSDFNAHIKVNGENGFWPDHGMVQFSTLLNTRPRRTQKPVTPFDLVAANGWQVLDNRVQNFVKLASDSPSYGLFMKGAGSGGRIERNLIVCTPSGISQPGLRVGLSLGNGGSSKGVCREGRCDAEHFGGAIVNNVVAHCNDVGIDVSKSVDTLVLHNTLINTLGVLVRNPPANAFVARNLMEGKIRALASTTLDSVGNVEASSLKDLLQDSDALDLRWREPPASMAPHEKAPLDFCGRRRPAATPPGATLAARC